MQQTSDEAIASGSTQGVVVVVGACVHEGLVKMLKVGVILPCATYTLFMVCAQRNPYILYFVEHPALDFYYELCLIYFN
jgi:hypothetical protein